jgi:hypothetical protein
MYGCLKVLLLVVFLCGGVFSQAQIVQGGQDKNSVEPTAVRRLSYAVRDSLRKHKDSVKTANRLAFIARQRFVTDSIMTHTWMAPDSLVDRSIIVDSLLNQVYNLPAIPWYELGKSQPVQRRFVSGTPVPKGELWVLGFVGLLLFVFALLKNSFSKQLQSIVQSFFSNRVLNNLNKEDNLFTSWPFLLLFIQFGFTIGLFFYLVTQYYHVSFGASGIAAFVSISVLIILLYAFKIVLLRVLGYLFSIQKPINEYISILYLSYFNISLLFIPLVTAFALSPLRYGVIYIAISMLIGVLIFVFQFIRAGINILSHYQFSKVYLFLYFCALEICPILILIKTIGL